ncbi:MAG: hypothetical protein M0D53_12485 [Flavobacterium sp. JAD_PAG50586_2]|nr:MAG: hypothetical protein M0D53_12485 [Flavobacterium sp. JAD_PAG50586_2]
MDKLKILSDTENYLKNSLDKLKDVKIEDLQSLKLNSLQFRNAAEASLSLKMLKKSSNPIIYVIELETKSIKKELLINFDEFTTYNIQKTKNKDRVNVSGDMKRDSHVLYVGSSTTDFKSRIKNHLGVRGNRVYSLHLCKMG